MGEFDTFFDDLIERGGDHPLDLTPELPAPADPVPAPPVPEVHPTGTDEFDHLFDSLLATKSDNEISAPIIASQTTPDKTAEANSLAKKTALPPAVVDRNLDEVRRREQAAALRAALEDSAVLRKFVKKDPRNLSLVADEIEGVDEIARGWKRFWATTQNVFISANDIVNALTPSFGELFFDSGGKGIIDDITDLQDMFGQFIGLRDDTEIKTKDIVRVDVAPGMSFEKVLEDPADNYLPFLRDTIVTMIPETVLTVAAWPAALAAIVGRLAHDRAKNDGRKEGTLLDMITVLPSSVAVVFLDRLGGRSFLGLDDALKAATKKEAGKAVSKAFAKETATEFSQEFIEETTSTLGTRTGFSLRGSLMAGAAGAAAGGPIGGGIRTVTAGAEVGLETHRAKKRTSAIRKMNNADSKLRARDVDAYAEVQALAMSEAGIEDVEITEEGARILQQDYGAVITDEQLTEAAVTGGTVTISPETFWSMPQEAIDKIAAHVSFTATTLSESEAIESEALVRQLTKEDGDAILAQAREGVVEEELVTEIQNRLIEAGGAVSAPSDARAQAQQMAAFFVTQARAAGVPVEAVIDRFLPTITREELDAAGNVEPQQQQTPTSAVEGERARREALFQRREAARKATKDAFEARDEGLVDRGLDPESAEAQGLFDAVEAAKENEKRVIAEVEAEARAASKEADGLEQAAVPAGEDVGISESTLKQSSVDPDIAGGLMGKTDISVADLEGAALIPLFADLTDTGSSFDTMDGVPLQPTPLYGGPNFPMLKEYAAEDIVWAFNAKGVITGLKNKIDKLRELGHERVVVTVLAMKDDAHTSNSMVTNALLRTFTGMVNSGRLPKKNLRAATKLFKSKASKKDAGYSNLAEFPGFNNITKLIEWVDGSSFNTRKALSKEMQTAEFRKLMGDATMHRVVRELVDPAYRATQQGDALIAFEIDTSRPDLLVDFDGAEAKAKGIPRHPSYRFGMRGKMVGSFKNHTPMSVLYKDLLGDVIARNKPSNPKFLMERLRKEDTQVVTPEIVAEAKLMEQLDEYRVAKAWSSGLAGEWRDSGSAANKGGINPAEYELAIQESQAAATLPPITRKNITEGAKDGTLKVFQLGDASVAAGGLSTWFATVEDYNYAEEYPGDVTQSLLDAGVLTDSEKALVGVVNNELGVNGMATFQVLKAIEEGVTVLDAFKVRSDAKPLGLLPTIYATMGFEEVGVVPFDPSFYSKAQLADLEAVWEGQGWKKGDPHPGVAIMKYRGSDDRSNASSRFIAKGQDGLGVRGAGLSAEFSAETIGLVDGAQSTERADGIAGSGDGRATPSGSEDRARSVAQQGRDFVDSILAADEVALDALKIPKARVDKIRAAFPPEEQTLKQSTDALRGPRAPDTAEFQNFIEDTWVTGDHTPFGTPRVVFHKTRGDFDTFIPGGPGGGVDSGNVIFFRDDPSITLSGHTARDTQEGVNERAVWLSIKDPLLLDEFNIAEMQDRFGESKKDFPLFVNDATVARLKEAGFDGIIYETSSIDGQPVTEYVVFDANQAKSATGNIGAFDPAVSSMLGQEVAGKPPRADINLTDLDNVRIRLFQAADFSSFLHESAHLYLAVMGELAALPTASPQLKGDFRVILDWLGAPNAAGVTDAMHEKMAESYEEYLREGKAPSLKLAEAFSKFGVWLTTLYRKLRAAGSLPNAALNPEIRDVFDRMLASQEEIEEARRASSMLPLFNGSEWEAAGGTEAEFNAYGADIEKATAAAHAELIVRALNDVKRETQVWWRRELATETQIILGRLDEDKAWQARHLLQHGNLPSGAGLPDSRIAMKLDRKSVQDHGVNPKELPGGGRMTRAEHGVHVDNVAEELGFGSGSELLEALINLPQNEDGKFLSAKQFARQQGEARLKERHGDIMNDGTMQEEALLRVHSEEQSRVLAKELRLLSKMTGGSQSTSNRIVKDAARRILDGKKIDEILKFNRFLAAEHKASNKAASELAKGNVEEAFAAKQQQLLNFHLYRQARQMAAQADTFTGRMSKWKKKMSPKVVNPTFIQQAQEMLAGTSFGKRVSERRIQTMTNQMFDRWAEEQNKTYGAQFHVSSELDAALTKDHYLDMTMGELAGLHDTVKSVVDQGRRYNAALNAQFDQKVGRLGESVESNRTKIVKEPREQGFISRVRGSGRHFMAEHRKMESLAIELDGGVVGGPIWTEIFQRIKVADDAHIDRSRRAGAELDKIFKIYGTKDKWSFFNKMYVPEIDDNLSLSARLSFALNMGNAGNIDALQEEYNDEQIHAVLATLTDKDWDVVEAVWKHVDSFWEDTLDKDGNVIEEGLKSLQERTTGVAPAKVGAIPFVTPGGREVTGGYYPLKADPNLSKQGAADYMDSQALGAFQTGGHASKSTKSGATIERRGFGTERKVWLDLRVAFEHIDGVIKDIEMREAVAEVHRVINHKSFVNAVTAAKGKEFTAMFDRWLANVIGNDTQPVITIEKMATYARTGASIAEMGLSLRTMLQQPVGYTQSVAIIGEKYAAIGAWKYFTERGDAARKVMEMSAFMRNRGATFNRDVRDAQRSLGVKGLQNEVTKHAFVGVQMLDMAVSIPTWLGAYEKSMDEQRATGAAEVSIEEAVAMADSAVSRSQGSGLPRDMADIQQGPQWKRMLTMFYTFFNAYYNLQTDLWKQTDFKSPLSALKFAKNQLYVTIIPSLVIDYLFNGIDDDDEPLQWAAESAGKFMLGGMVVVRDVANAATTGYGYQLTPASNVVKFALDAGKQLNQGENDAELWRALIMAAGYSAHLPGTRQAERMVRTIDKGGFRELDEFESWWRLLVMGPKK
jgi:hypothetical protein